jgi:UDP-N-acetylglucosamine/UDP-N-acetylgalactosamine diphosphorylase
MLEFYDFWEAWFMDMEEKLKRVLFLVEEYNQKQLLHFFNVLSEKQQEKLVDQILNIDFQLISSLYGKLSENIQNKKEYGDFAPMGSTSWSELADWEKRKVYNAGLDVLAKGKAAAVLVAGGQGTRLGHNGPKGTYNIGLPSGNTLFQLQCHRLINLSNKANCYIPWYIMTSDENHEATVAYFEKNHYLGYPREYVCFFKQEMLPVIDSEGKIVLHTKDSISMGPNGNGGCFLSMGKAGVVDDMLKKGIEWINIYGVDNALVLPADPRFIGFAQRSGLQAASKAVRRNNPEEKAGIFCYNHGRPLIIEYSEVTEDLKYKTGSDGKLIFDNLSIANHVFSMEVIENSCSYNLPYHVAFKMIKTVDKYGEDLQPDKPNAYKFELFMFDIFPFLNDLAVFQVNREEEFAPVKNREGEDSPEAARRLIHDLHHNWLTQVDISREILKDKIIEVSPLTSCFGENLNKDLILEKINKFEYSYII